VAQLQEFEQELAVERVKLFEPPTPQPQTVQRTSKVYTEQLEMMR
jgi:hypothetical protein